MKNTRMIQLAIATALGLGAARTFAGSDTWSQTAAGTHSWNVGGNWLSGVQFPNGVDDTATITTTLPTGTTTVNLNQNITLGTLSMGRASQTLTIAGGTPAGRLIFDASSGSAALNILAGAGNTVSSGIVLADPFVVNNAVAGTLSGGIFGYGNVTKQGAGTLTLHTAASTFLGNLSLVQGTVERSSGTPFRSTATIDLASGTFLKNTATNSRLTVGGLTGSGTFQATVTNEKLLGIDNAANNVFTGTISFLNGNVNNLIKSNIGTFTLAGAGNLSNGSGTTTIIVNGGAVELDNTGTNNGNRIADTVHLNLGGGDFRLTGSGAGNTTETINNLSATAGKITVAPGTGYSAVLTLGTLTIGGANSSVVFRGTGLGGTGADTSQIKFGTTPTLIGGNATGPQTSIIAGALGANSSTSGGTGLVTYDAALGVRLLNENTEYADYASANTNDNAKFTASGNVTATTSGTATPTTINSLLLKNTGGSLMTVTLDNGVTLTPTSTTYLFSGDASNPVTLTKNGVSGTGKLQIAATQGYKMFVAADTTATINAPMNIDYLGAHGNSGLAKDGEGTLVLNQNLTAVNTGSPFAGTGIIRINAGTLKAGAANIVGFYAPSQSNNGGASVIIASGATFDLAGFDQTFVSRTKLTANAGSFIINTSSTSAILNPSQGGYSKTGAITLDGTIADGNGASAGGLVSLSYTTAAEAGAALNVAHGGNELNNLTVNNTSSAQTATATLNSLSIADTNIINGAIAVGGGTGSAASVLVANTIGNGTSQATTLGSAPITLNRNGRLTINSRGETAALSGQTVTWANNVTANEAGVVTVGSADSGVSTNVTQKLGSLTISGLSRIFTATANNDYTLEFTGATTLTNTTATAQTLNVTAGTLKLADVGQSGTGNKGIIKSGAGTLEVADGSTLSYLGTTAVTNGVFLMNGTSSSQDNWSVYGGALLGGTGSIGLTSGKSMTVGGASAGVLAPGNASIGTLSVGGAVVFDALSILRAEIGADGASDRVAVTGDLELKDGATLDLLPLAGAWDGVYTIATFTGSRSGKFTTVNGLDPSYAVKYNASSITLGPAGTVITVR